MEEVRINLKKRIDKPTGGLSQGASVTDILKPSKSCLAANKVNKNTKSSISPTPARPQNLPSINSMTPLRQNETAEQRYSLDGVAARQLYKGKRHSVNEAAKSALPHLGVGMSPYRNNYSQVVNDVHKTIQQHAEAEKARREAQKKEFAKNGKNGAVAGFSVHKNPFDI
jgi:hypothetical protein